MKVDPPAVIGRRLYALRVAKGYADDQKGFAKFCGIGRQAWNNWELGRRRPDLDAAVKILKETGARIEWIYLGDTVAMPVDLWEKIKLTLSGPERIDGRKTRWHTRKPDPLNEAKLAEEIMRMIKTRRPTSRP